LELNNTLDHKIGGPIAAQLEQLYMFVTEQYTKSNISGEVKPLKDALKVLENLYEGWKGAVENLKKEKDKETAK
jgi:flagellar protein FliS